MKHLVLVGMLALGACAPSIDPAAKASLERWNAGIQPSGAAFGDQGVTKTPPAVGQWAEYRDTGSDGAISRRTQKIVGQEGDAYWLETESETVSGGTTIKALVAMQDWSRPGPVDVRRLITQSDGQPPQEVPSVLAQTMAASLTRSLSWTVTEGAVEAVSVPAGQFEARVIRSEGTNIPFIGDTSGTAWFNAAVPISGAVKTSSANGYSSELVAFGESGATSSIALP